MTDELYRDRRQPAGRTMERAVEGLEKAWDTVRAAWRVAYKEAAVWDVFRWIVVVLLAANFLLAALLYSSIKSGIAELRQRSSAEDLRSEVEMRIGETTGALRQEFSDRQAGLQEELAKTNARLDKLMQAPQRPATMPPEALPPRPVAKPGR